MASFTCSVGTDTTSISFEHPRNPTPTSGSSPTNDRSHLVPDGFTATPNVVLLDTSLSRDARFLYSLLKSRCRARTGWWCAVGYGWLCMHMGVGEDVVRRAMSDLVARGIIARERHGQGRVNSYRLLVVEDGRTRGDRDLEPDRRAEKEDIQEEYRERATALESSIGFPISEMSSGDPPDLPPASSEVVPSPTVPTPADPEHDRVTLMLGDIRRELGDRATVRATVSRAVNLKRRAGADWETFAAAVYGARAATQARTHAIRDRDVVGVHKTGYFFAVLADRLGLRETPPPNPPSVTLPPRNLSAPVVAPTETSAPTMVQGNERVTFWEQLRAETGVNDLTAYCHICGRPPIYDDLGWSIRLVQEKRRR